MSWKGVVKAATRLPAMIGKSVGMSETTVDEEYNQLLAHFKIVDANTRRLQDEILKFRNALTDELSHQVTLAHWIAEIFQVEGLNSPEPAYAGGAAPPPPPAVVMGPSTASPALVQAVSTFHRESRVIQEALQPRLDDVERRLVAPIRQFVQLLDGVKRTMTKRDHKLLDHDRHRQTLRKLTDSQERTAGDEKKRGQMEVTSDQATREYNHYNNLLKSELPLLFRYAGQIADPCLWVLYTYQKMVLEAFTRMMRAITALGYFDMSTSARGGFNDHIDRMDAMLTSLAFHQKRLTSPEGKIAASDHSPVPSYAAPHGAAGSQVESAGVYGDTPAPPYQEASPYGLGAGSAAAAAAATHVSPKTSFGSATAGVSPRPQPPMSGISPTPAMAAAPPPPPAALPTCTALYDFAAQEPGDLGFSRGDIIEILERGTTPESWWRGRLVSTGKEGSFPGNYVA
ncbi:hypothetical protein CXG81DRAFT_23194 [Caulochytrium protostelioides]|uniref:BAR-domain-containing protein n=1 Tax=Caulochytrium protostelioides TaxID=1555241 RepID=A0A4P9XF98_9FUNG|nr:hypothetical protein CXG81DRAFT_23194 [Caulochytrium protostelioides]|eukprot:RKP04242.1 hypothetical protein CXG81DRAFT_23194 [Caulochytrium protostelioides]